MPLGGGGQFIHLFFMHFFYILQPLLLGYSLYRGAVYNALVLAVSSLRLPELPAFLARVAQNTAGPFFGLEQERQRRGWHPEPVEQHPAQAPVAATEPTWT